MTDQEHHNVEIQASRIAGEQALAHMLSRPGEPAWIIDQNYDERERRWMMDIVRKGPQGIWMRFRYGYDTIAGVVYYFGEHPAEKTLLDRVRNEGRRLETV